MKAFFLSAAAAVAFIASPAMAASTDGVLSQTNSTGTFDVSVEVVPMVSVSGLDAINLTINPATIAGNFGTTTGRTQFCVYSNVSNVGSYNVQVTGAAGDGLSNPYALTGNTTGSKLNHTVGFYDNATYNSVAATFMRSTTVLPAQTTRGGQARATTLNCTNDGLAGSNASLQVGIRNPVALAALADTYQGTLSVRVSVP